MNSQEHFLQLQIHQERKGHHLSAQTAEGGDGAQGPMAASSGERMLAHPPCHGEPVREPRTNTDAGGSERRGQAALGEQ